VALGGPEKTPVWVFNIAEGKIETYLDEKGKR
jgi:hypothetical protein